MDGVDCRVLGNLRRLTLAVFGRGWPRTRVGQRQVTYLHEPVRVALPSCVPRWSDIRWDRDRRRSSLYCSRLRQRGEMRARQPSCSRAWRTAVRQQVRGTQGPRLVVLGYIVVLNCRQVRTPLGCLRSWPRLTCYSLIRCSNAPTQTDTHFHSARFRIHTAVGWAESPTQLPVFFFRLSMPLDLP
jgi:hypothetical protein